MLDFRQYFVDISSTNTQFSAQGGSFFNLAPPSFSLACDPEFCKTYYGENLLACVPGKNDPANELFELLVVSQNFKA